MNADQRACRVLWRFHIPGSAVPAAAALDVARLADGRFVLLEANQCWSAALYGCDPDAVLLAVLAANVETATGPGLAEPWLWRPDPVLDLDVSRG